MNAPDASTLEQSSDWLTHEQYEYAIRLSHSMKRPILIFFNSASCGGCRQLSAVMRDDSRVHNQIMDNFVPVEVMVETPAPDELVSRLVGSHIFIMSSVLQVVSREGNILHKINDAPLHTRHGIDYTSTHHDISGCLDAEALISELNLGLAKASFFGERRSEADSQLREALNTSKPRSITHQECEYWLSQCDNVDPSTITIRPYLAANALSRSVENFCLALLNVPDDVLMQDWRGDRRSGSWLNYSDCLREIVFGVIQSMNQLSVERPFAVAEPRSAELLGHLENWHIAFRELQGLLVGLSNKEADHQHFSRNFSLGKQRTIRNNFVHCVTVEKWAHGPAIRKALASVAERPVESAGLPLCPQEALDFYGQPPKNFGCMTLLMQVFEEGHFDLLREFSRMDPAALNTSSSWWEAEGATVRFRLGRLGWHLHDHITVIEWICERIGRKRTERERLIRLLHRSLAAAEIRTNAFDQVPDEAMQELAEEITFWSDQVRST